MLKFASRIRLVSETGELIRFVHAEEAERLFRAGQALRRESGKTVRELLLPDRHPQQSSFIRSDSRSSVYKETLDGGAKLLIETRNATRPVVTLPCHVYKMKTIRSSQKPFYEAVVQQALSRSISDEEYSAKCQATKSHAHTSRKKVISNA